MKMEKLESIHRDHPDIYFKDPLLTDPGKLKLTDPKQISTETLSGYSLTPGSPLIDKGISKQPFGGISGIKTDIAGTPIPQGGNVDIGAVEFAKKK
jgi:hypothetical protein